LILQFVKGAFSILNPGDGEMGVPLEDNLMDVLFQGCGQAKEMIDPTLADAFVMESPGGIGHCLDTGGQGCARKIDGHELLANGAEKVGVPPGKLRLFAEVADEQAQDGELIGQLGIFLGHGDSPAVFELSSG
jgi:hypothetical protein